MQQRLDHALKAISLSNYDYAVDLLGGCLLIDPGNRTYAEHIVSSLRKKYGKKKGQTLAGLKTARSRASMNAAVVGKKWLEVLRQALEVIKANPGDTGALLAAAGACESLDCPQTEQCFCEAALLAAPESVDVNRKVGEVFERLGLFQEAVKCWQRIQRAKPDDQSVRRKIKDLYAKKNLVEAKYDQAETAQDLHSETGLAASAAAEQNAPEQEVSEEQRLRDKIAAEPEQLSPYLELADLMRDRGDFAQAEATLQQALDASGGDLGVREQLETVQLVIQRDRRALAQRLAEQEPTPARQETYQHVQAEVLKFELEYYRVRVDRYPDNVQYRFELATRLERLGNHKEAISSYQKAKGDPSHQGLVLLGLGRCFQHIRQFPLALNHYLQATEAIPANQLELKKEAHYLAGRLALGLKKREVAETHLTELASMDFDYKDVATLLDKLSAEDDIT